MPDVGIGYCEPEDVRKALQERDLSADLGVEFVEPAILGQSEWLRKQTQRHWYDSTAAESDVVATAPMSATNIRLDVPSAPHVQDRQLLSDEIGARYPRTTAGRYAKVRLPHHHVEALSALHVRGRDGDAEDWTTAPDMAEGRGEDYYLETTELGGESYLFVHAASVGPRVDYGDLLTVDYEFGHDGISDTVRRGVALLAAADVVLDDDADVAIPSDGQLVGLDTKADKMRKEAHRLLKPYKGVPVA